jgi:hypothetical protein
MALKALPGRLGSALEVLREQLHEHAIVPGPVGSSFVLAHDPHAAEADLFVGTDRLGVLDRRVDDDPMVAPLLEKGSCQNPDHLAGKAASPEGPAQEEIEARVPILGIVILLELDRSNYLASMLDGENRHVFPRLDELPADGRFVVPTPPASHFRVAESLEKLGQVFVPGGAKSHPFGLQAARWHGDELPWDGPGPPACGLPALQALRNRSRSTLKYVKNLEVQISAWGFAA